MDEPVLSPASFSSSCSSHGGPRATSLRKETLGSKGFSLVGSEGRLADGRSTGIDFCPVGHVRVALGGDFGIVGRAIGSNLDPQNIVGLPDRPPEL